MAKDNSKGCFGTILKWGLILTLLIAATLTAAWFWFTRPITPITLEPSEIQAVEQKITPIINDLSKGLTPNSKTITLTERELNGYLHHKSKYGDKAQFDLEPNLIIAHINVELPNDAPALAGQRIRAKFEIKVSVIDGTPSVEIISAQAFGSSFPEKHIQKYMHTNLYKKIKEVLQLNYDVNSLSSIDVQQDQITLTFLP